MPKLERVREVVSSLPTPDYWIRKAEGGWKLVAVEWAREVETDLPAPSLPREEVPFGLQVADDCLHLEENPTERAALMLMMELIVEDKPLSQVASELNRRGFRMRHGSAWGPESVFDLLPRLIEVAPRISTSQDWVARRVRTRSLTAPHA